jgi:hypothetical protein
MNAFVDLLARLVAPPKGTSLMATTLHKDGSVSADVETFMASAHGQRELNRAQLLWEKHWAPLAS